VFGVKGLATTETTTISGANASKRWYTFEPWGRGTIAWTLRDYSGSTHATHRWIADSCVPKDAEAGRAIDRVRYSLADYNTGMVIGTSTLQTTRDFRGDNIWVGAEQSFQDAENLYDLTFIRGIGAYGYVNDVQLPFVVPIGYFCRLRLVYDNDGAFFWEVEAFGQIS
jgi:hypothetical protein